MKSLLVAACLCACSSLPSVVVSYPTDGHLGICVQIGPVRICAETAEELERAIGPLPRQNSASTAAPTVCYRAVPGGLAQEPCTEGSAVERCEAAQGADPDVRNVAMQSRSNLSDLVRDLCADPIVLGGYQ